MKKDIEWLKSAIQQNLDFYNDKDEEWQMAKVRAYAKSLDLINQLDESEVLSQKWISENVEYAYFDMLDGSGRLSSATAIIKPEKLQNLLVPKQELPVIPKFVAEWIESRKNNYPSDVIGAYLRMNELSANEQTREVLSWVHESELNRSNFARAWLDGYTVEEEQKYVVKIPTNENNDIPYAIVADSGDIWTDALPSKYKLTEEEIRGLTKGDVLFEHFAVKVEELEE